MIRNHANTFSYVTKDGSTIRELFHPGSAPVRGFSVAEALVEPGQETGLHKHLQSQEVYYVLEGTGVMRLGEETFAVKPFDAILILPGTRHSIKNDGKSSLRILCVCSPPYSHGDTVLDEESTARNCFTA